MWAGLIIRSQYRPRPQNTSRNRERAYLGSTGGLQPLPARPIRLPWRSVAPAAPGHQFSTQTSTRSDCWRRKSDSVRVKTLSKSVTLGQADFVPCKFQEEANLCSVNVLPALSRNRLLRLDCPTGSDQQHTRTETSRHLQRSRRRNRAAIFDGISSFRTPLYISRIS